MISTVWGSTDKPISAKQLADVLVRQREEVGTLYIGYPLLGAPDGAFPIDALLISPALGLILFDLVEGRDIGDFAVAQDEAYNRMQAKFLQYPKLRTARTPLVKIRTATFAPAVPNAERLGREEYPVCDENNLLEVLNSNKAPLGELFPTVLSVVQAISTLRRGRRKRILQKAESRGAKAKLLEDSIANLDSHQSAAVVETFEGVQRIRGLAGTGKTIVLALKVAYLHSRHPEWDIAVTFNTRSLKNQFKNLITTFVLEQANEEPDWDKIRILNAWGAPGNKERGGIYFEFCTEHGIEYFDLRTARSRFSTGNEFESVCDAALRATKTFVPKYDAILIDEAQDFAPNFLLLCYEYLKAPKRLVYAYDELQNLGRRSLPPAEEIFGKSPDGNLRVTFTAPEPGKPRQDIILDVCYRNSRPVLSTAHALGFGIYRANKGLVQIFENKELWLDIGYVVEGGALEDGQEVALARSARSSPKFLENHSPTNDLIEFRSFASEQDQTKWLVDAIEGNLQEDELLPEDVLVINPDPFTTRSAVGEARAALLSKKINSTLAGVTGSADVFQEPDNVTFTGIFRAKGNEAAMVYVINAQDCFTAGMPGQVARVRNRLFTAITRSKAWVRVLGVGKGMEALQMEFEKVKEANFQLQFKYPTETERKQMTIVNRDMSKAEKAGFQKRRDELIDIIESLESGETFIEDYPEDVIARLQAALSKGPK